MPTLFRSRVSRSRVNPEIDQRLAVGHAREHVRLRDGRRLHDRASGSASSTSSAAICGVTLSVSVVGPHDRRLVVEREQPRIGQRRHLALRGEQTPAAWSRRSRAARSATAVAAAAAPGDELAHLSGGDGAPVDARRLLVVQLDLDDPRVDLAPGAGRGPAPRRDRPTTRSSRSGKSVTCSRPALRSTLNVRVLGQQRPDAVGEVREDVGLRRARDRGGAASGRRRRRPSTWRCARSRRS